MALRLRLRPGFHGAGRRGSVCVLEEGEMDMRLHRRKRKKGDTAKLANLLAPLEELDSTSAAKQLGANHPPIAQPGDPHFGAIVIDNEGLQVPREIMEASDEKTILGMERVVLVILGVMLAFIAFIAWQISQMTAE